MNKAKFVVFTVFMILISAMSVKAASITSMSDTASISISLLSTDPDPAVAGDVVELRLGISNSGGKDVNDLVVEFVPTFPFKEISGSNIQHIDIVQGYQGQNNDLKTITLKALVDKDAPVGTYEFTLKYYSNNLNGILTETIPIEVKSRETAEIIHIDKTVLIPGVQTPLKFVINNVGNAPLKDLTFSWSDDDNILLPVGSDNTRYVKYIGLNSSTEVDYEVIADTNAQSGLYKLNLYLRYHDSINNSERQITTIAGVYIGGETDFDVAFSESSSGQTSFTVANIGSNPASAVSIIIPRQSLWTITGSNSMIVGNLNKGDYTVASFTLQQSSFMQNRTRGNYTQNMPSDIPRGNNNVTVSSPNMISVQIAYTDTMGVRRLIDKQVQMNSQKSGNSTSLARNGQFSRTPQQSTFSKYMWYIILFIVLVTAFIVYGRYKRNKLMNPKAKFADVFRKKK